MDLHDPFWTELAGRYQPERPIGAGGMAEVWLVSDERHGRHVAMKLLGEDLASTIGRDRFKREIELLARLQHPNVLPLIDSGESAGRLWYVTPFIAGESLRDRIVREGKLEISEALRLGTELLDALGYAHRSGVVHRDIKPENILLSEGHALLADFGIAREAGKDRLTATGLSLGTPSYMSPEQVAGEPAGAPSDIYAMACVLFECLTGQPPFSGPDARAVMAQHVMDPAPSLRARRPTVPEGVELVVLRALEKDPKDRWTDAAEFAKALNQAYTSRTELVAGGARQRRSKRRRRALAVGGAALLLAAAAWRLLLWRPASNVAEGPNVPLRQVTFRGDACEPLISPNGRYLSYLAAEQLWLLDLERDQAWPVSDSVPEFRCPAEQFSGNWWTDDGQAVVFVTGDSTYRAGTGGERARPVGADSVADSLASRAGRIVGMEDPQAGDSSSWSAVTVRTLGHGPRRLPLKGLRRALLSHNGISADGSRALIFWVGGDTRFRYAIVDLDSGRVAPIDSGALGGYPLGWSPDGLALYVHPDTGPGMLRYALDHARLRPSGRITTLVPGVREGFAGGSFARSRDRMALERSQLSADVIIGHLAGTGPQRHWSLDRVTPGSLVPSSAAMTPGPDRLLFVAKADSSYSLFAMAMPRGAPRQLARLPDAAYAMDFRLSPDGSTAVVGILGGHGWRSVLIDLRSGATRDLPGWRPGNLSHSPWGCETFDWDPTGKIVFAPEWAPQWGIIRMNAVTGVADTLRADSGAFVDCPAASPDGKWIAVNYGTHLRHGFLLLPLSGDSARFFPAPRSGPRYPLGWLSSNELLVAEDLFTDSIEVWVYSLAGKWSMLGRLPTPCWAAQLAPSRRDVVCIEHRPRSDVWVADDFDPYFHQPLASTPRR